MIPSHLLGELRYLEISTARGIRTARVGPYTSRTRGSGLDFDQHVPYRPGDDVRRIDWNVTARLNAPYVRQTHAERELDLVIALDMSRSMELGAGRYSKKEVLTFVSGSLLFSAAADQINAGFMAFSDRVLAWAPPRRVSGRAWALIEDIWALKSERSRTTMIPALRHLLATLKTMSIVAIVSDFITADRVFESVELRMLAARHDVLAIIVEDPAEAALPDSRGFLRVKDVESGEEVLLALSAGSRRAYADARARWRQTIADASFRLGMKFVFVRSDVPVMQPVVELFARRRSA
ncbi:MAG: DUF58 domain-containing protein [Vicinamibacterales bacterium]